MSMLYSKIVGTGSYVPEKLVTNDDLSKILDTSDEWISSRTGIKSRHFVDKNSDETATVMGVKAAQKALESSQTPLGEIDLIIVATISGDYKTPSCACLIQEKLGAKNAAAFDISAACAGSVYGLEMADALIKSGKYRSILFICAEVMSSILNFKDRNTAVLFGDAASACVIKPSKDPGFLGFKLYADGTKKDVIKVPGEKPLAQLTPNDFAQDADKLAMNGRETYKFAIRSMGKAIEDILQKCSLSKEDISYVVPHQANLRIIESLAERAGVPLNKFLINLDRYANTSSASLLLAYDENARKNLFKPNEKVLMLAIGAGFVWGAGVYVF